MTDTLRLIIFCAIGAWAFGELYHDLKNPKRRQRLMKFLYWFSIVIVPLTAHVFSLAWATK